MTRRVLRTVSFLARRDRSRRDARRAPVPESRQRCHTTNGRSLLVIRHVRPTRCRLLPCRSMKVSLSDSTERRSFGTFMGPSLATNLAAQRAPDTSAPPDWTRTAGSSSSSNPSIPRADPGLRPERSGAAGTDRGQEVLVPYRTRPLRRYADGKTGLVHAPQGVEGLVAAHPASSGQPSTAEFSAGRWQRKNDFLYRIEKLTSPRRA